MLSDTERMIVMGLIMLGLLLLILFNPYKDYDDED